MYILNDTYAIENGVIHVQLHGEWVPAEEAAEHALDGMYRAFYHWSRWDSDEEFAALEAWQTQQKLQAILTERGNCAASYAA